MTFDPDRERKEINLRFAGTGLSVSRWLGVPGFYAVMPNESFEVDGIVYTPPDWDPTDTRRNPGPMFTSKDNGTIHAESGGFCYVCYLIKKAETDGAV